MTREEITEMSDADVATLCTQHQLENVVAQRDGFSASLEAAIANAKMAAAEAAASTKTAVDGLTKRGEELAGLLEENAKQLADALATVAQLTAKIAEMESHPDVIATRKEELRRRLEETKAAYEAAQKELEG